MKSYPTRFEIVDEDLEELVAVVDEADDAAARIEVKFAHNSASWEILAAEIAKCLKAMELEGDDK